MWSEDDIRAGPTTWREQDLEPLLANLPTPSRISTTRTDAATSTSISTSHQNLLVSRLFLEQGARALLAFCRPYPVAVVGFPERLLFSVETSLLELDIRVEGGESFDQEGGVKDEGEQMEGLPTEVYIPFVHYRTEEAGQQPEEWRVGDDDEPGKLSEAFLDRLAIAGRDRFLNPGEMDVEVFVSEGRWEIEGQLLKWWYDPQRTGERIVRMTVKKRGRAGT